MKMISEIKTVWDYLGRSPQSDNAIIGEILRGIYQSLYKSMHYLAPTMLLFSILTIMLASTSDALSEGKKKVEATLIIVLIASNVTYWLNLILAIVLELAGII